MTRRCSRFPQGGRPRPIDPAWQLSPAEIWSMLSRPYFGNYVVVRRPRKDVHTRRRIYGGNVHTGNL